MILKEGEEMRVKGSVGPLGVLKELLAKLQFQDTAQYNKSCQGNHDVKRASNADVQYVPSLELYRVRTEEQFRTEISDDIMFLSFLLFCVFVCS